MKIQRLFSSIAPFIILILMEISLSMPSAFYVYVVIANLVLILALRVRLSGFRANSSRAGVYLILPILYLNGSVFLSAILVSAWIIQLVYISLFIFIYLYYRYLPEDENDVLRRSKLENVSSYGNFLVIFFFGSTLFSLQSYFSVSFSLIMACWVLILATVIYQVMQAGELDFRKNLPIYFLSVIVLSEIAWSLSFLPLLFNVLGLIMAICYYMLIGLMRFYLRRNLSPGNIKLYLLFGLSGITLILLSSRWI